MNLFIKILVFQILGKYIFDCNYSVLLICYFILLEESGLNRFLKCLSYRGRLHPKGVWSLILSKFLAGKNIVKHEVIFHSWATQVCLLAFIYIYIYIWSNYFYDRIHYVRKMTLSHQSSSARFFSWSASYFMGTIALTFSPSVIIFSTYLSCSQRFLYTRIHTFIHIYTYTKMPTYLRTYTYTDTYIHTYIHTYIYIYIYIYIMYVYIYIYILHIYIYIYIYIYMSGCISVQMHLVMFWNKIWLYKKSGRQYRKWDWQVLH